jgi:putative transposase
MPRQARLDTPGALHHIMVRGINKTKIFRDDQDRCVFLERMGKAVIETRSSVCAWALMDTHVHILVRSGGPGISTLMRRLLTWYAQYYNRRHRRTGHLFENRYKSVLCDEETYLLSLVRYIHLNPVRAQIVTGVDDLDRYPWSGHRMIVNDAAAPSWMDVAHVLARFGGTKRRAIREYRRFVEEGASENRNPMLTGGGMIRSRGGWSQVLSLQRKGEREESDERILGGGEFVSQVLREVEERELRQTRLRRLGKSIADVIREECQKSRVNPEELAKGSRRRRVSRVRAVIAVRCKEELGESGAEIARHLGVNTSSINRSLARMDEVGLE